jgi:hypothetical protein
MLAKARFGGVRECIDEPETHVVTRERVLGAGVAEADDEA